VVSPIIYRGKPKTTLSHIGRIFELGNSMVKHKNQTLSTMNKGFQRFRFELGNSMVKHKNQTLGVSSWAIVW
jgi:hypothetical protein